MEELENARDDLRLAASQVRRLAELLEPPAGAKYEQMLACTRVLGSLAARIERQLIALEQRYGAAVYLPGEREDRS